MRIGFSSAYVLMVTFVTVGARADDATRRRANDLYRHGAAAALRGDPGEAYADFAESYRLWPRGATLGNLGWAEVELGHVLDGVRHLKEAVRAPDVDDAKRAVIQGNINEVDPTIGHLVIDADEGAHVTVDGAALVGPAFHAPVDVSPGQHELAAAAGTRTRRATVEAPAGVRVAVDLHVMPKAEDGMATRAERPSTPPLSFATSDDSVANHPASPTWWSLPHSLGVGLGAMTLVAAGVGVSFEVASQAAADDARRLRAGLGNGVCEAGGATGPCSALRDKLNAVHTDESIAHVSLVVGAAAAVGTAIAFLLETRREKSDRSALRWGVGPGGGLLGGDF